MTEFTTGAIQKIFEKFDSSLDIRSVRDFGGGGLYNTLFLVETNTSHKISGDPSFILRIARQMIFPSCFMNTG